MIQSVFSSDLPRRFDDRCGDQTNTDGKAAGDEPQQAVEDEAVDDVRGRIPVGEMLRILRADHHPLPELDGAALADRRAAHEEQHKCRDGDHSKRDGKMTAVDFHGWPSARENPLPGGEGGCEAAG